MRTTILALGLGLGATVTLAQAPAAPPKAAPELDQLTFFAGQWQCVGQAPASELGPARPTRTNMTITRDLGGFAYGFRLAEEKTKDNPNPTQGMGFFAFDGAEKKLVAHSTDSFGTYVQASKGWEGDKMVVEGPGTAAGQKVQARDTFVKAGAAAFTHTYDLNLSGKWLTVVDEKCQKATAAGVKK
jgi:hypothetical protein